MTYKITLNGKIYEVAVERGEAIMVDVAEAAVAAPVAMAAAPAAVAAAAAPAAAPVAGGGEAINSPLPGTILALNVSAGQSVQKGQILLVIEAMKMENEVLATRDGTVVQVVVAKGATVSTGDPLLVLS